MPSDRPLPPVVHWEDFISEYDPVQLDFICKAFPDPAEVTQPAVRHNVVNQMDMLSEHNSYWNNAEEVLAPILNVITGGAFSQELGLE